MPAQKVEIIGSLSAKQIKSPILPSKHLKQSPLLPSKQLKSPPLPSKQVVNKKDGKIGTKSSKSREVFHSVNSKSVKELFPSVKTSETQQPVEPSSSSDSNCDPESRYDEAKDVDTDMNNNISEAPSLIKSSQHLTNIEASKDLEQQDLSLDSIIDKNGTIPSCYLSKHDSVVQDEQRNTMKSKVSETVADTLIENDPNHEVKHPLVTAETELIESNKTDEEKLGSCTCTDQQKLTKNFPDNFCKSGKLQHLADDDTNDQKSDDPVVINTEDTGVEDVKDDQCQELPPDRDALPGEGFTDNNNMQGDEDDDVALSQQFLHLNENHSDTRNSVSAPNNSLSSSLVQSERRSQLVSTNQSPALSHVTCSPPIRAEMVSVAPAPTLDTV